MNSFIAGSAFCSGPPNRGPLDSEKRLRVYKSSATMALHAWRVDKAPAKTHKNRNARLDALRSAVPKNIFTKHLFISVVFFFLDFRLYYRKYSLIKLLFTFFFIENVCFAEEADNLSSRLQASRQRVAELERSLASAKSSSQQYQKVRDDGRRLVIGQ